MNPGASLLPNGALALFNPAQIPDEMSEMPNEFKVLCGQLYSKEIGPMRFLQLFEDWQMKAEKAAKLTSQLLVGV